MLYPLTKGTTLATGVSYCTSILDDIRGQYGVFDLKSGVTGKIVLDGSHLFTD